jgi:hypothetical protein
MNGGGLAPAASSGWNWNAPCVVLGGLVPAGVPTPTVLQIHSTYLIYRT